MINLISITDTISIDQNGESWENVSAGNVRPLDTVIIDGQECMIIERDASEVGSGVITLHYSVTYGERGTLRVEPDDKIMVLL